MRLALCLNREELNALQYPILVECWERSMGSRKFKLKYREEFTEAERETVSRYRAMFYRWHLVTGTPEHCTMFPATLGILKRAVDFFATN